MKLQLFEIRRFNKHLDKRHVELIDAVLTAKSKSILILDEQNQRIDDMLYMETIKNTAIVKLINSIKKTNKQLDKETIDDLDRIKDLATPTPKNYGAYYLQLEQLILKELENTEFVEYKDFRLKLSFDTINNKPSYFTLYILEDLSNGIFDFCNIDLLKTYTLKDLELNKKILGSKNE